MSLPKICTIDGCERRHRARGLCGAHYQAAAKDGTLRGYAISAPPPSDHCLWCGVDIPESPYVKRFCDPTCRQRATIHKLACTVWPDCGHERVRQGKARKPALERLLNLIDSSGGTDACWPWIGCRSDRNYGQVSVWRDGRYVRTNAHRAMYIEVAGPIPDGVVVRHLCNNPPCCNPAHLRPGTQVDNMEDRRTTGAGYARGGEAPTAVQIAPEVVAAIRAEYRPGIKGSGQHAIAGRFGLSRSTVQRIVTAIDRWAEPA